MKALIHILVGVALLKVALIGSDVNQVEQKLTAMQSQIQMARLAMPVLRSIKSI
jgi:hypothetical protein